MVQGLENEMAGVRSGRIIPRSCRTPAHLRDHPEPTLVDLPVRVLLDQPGPHRRRIRRSSRATSSG